MRTRWFLAAIGLLALAPLAALLLALERAPRVERPVVITPDQVERAKRIVDTHRYRVRPGMIGVVNVLPDDADAAANYLARRFAQGSAGVTLGEGKVDLQLSVPVLGHPPAAFLNIGATLVQTLGLPRLESLRVGRLPVPTALVDRFAPTLLRWLGRDAEVRMALDALQQVRMSTTRLTVVYRWQGGNPFRAGSSVFAAADRERLLRQQTLLATASRRDGSAPATLSGVLQPQLQLAAERSAGGDAVAENRAAILVTTLHVLGVPLHQVLPEAAGWPRPVGRSVTLDGRDDLAKHFMLSAAIAAYADTALADAIGLYKEIEDARSGSGFSFNDLAADRAGTTFGEKAVAGVAPAGQLQHRVAAGVQDTDLMPPWRDLPESLPEPVFRQRFGGVDAPAYRAMMQEIEQRVAALRVLR
jgi:hypothetical protein